MRAIHAILATVAAASIGAGAWLWQRDHESLPATPTPSATAPSSAAAVAPAQAPTASEPAIKHPLDLQNPAEPVTTPLDAGAALDELFGRKTVLSVFRVESFPQRFVATVDNLGRAHAPASVWPVNPAGGRFLVDQRDDGFAVGSDNGLRYTPYVLLIETVDLHQAVGIYKRLYPAFQQAYESLGYPNRYFNDRLVEVLDELLAAPVVDGPLKVHLPTIEGPQQPARPWVLYEFDDPALEQLSAGQKILLRMGPVNERRVQARLKQLRDLIAPPGAAR
jgi:hypothetical protein